MTHFTKAGVWIGFALLALPSAVRAEDVEKRFRIGFSLGAYDSRAQIPSDSGNVLTLTDQDDIAEDFFVDPRNDDAAIGTLSLNSAAKATLSAQYTFTKVFVMEFSAGYQKGDVGDVEIQAQFDGDPIPPNNVLPFQFRIFRINAGEVTQLPLRVTALARFRPKAGLNPYLGLGIGYTIVGFDPSGDLNELSRNMDRSIGSFAKLQSFPGALNPSNILEDLSGVTVDARDTFEWHLAGGIEYRLVKNWATFLDVRYSFASRSFNILFNGQEDIGISVPSQRVFRDDPIASATFGAFDVNVGGLVDGGRLVPPASDPTVDCAVDPLQCTFELNPDGVPDPGFYYVQGGDLRFDNVTIEIGLRYTF